MTEKLIDKGSNRTIVGLKLSLRQWDRFWASQQSHHCGIETDGWAPHDISVFVQQSHHCGIETAAIKAATRNSKMAAIAPLWD